MIERICRRLLRDEFEAEDAAQQTFLSAYKALLGGVEPRDGEAWLATIARNECLQRIRTRMRRPLPVIENELEDFRPGVHQLALDRLNAARLWNEISRLPQQQRDAVILREVAGLSYEELGLLLGVTRPGVESLLFRARARLRNRLRAALASVNLAGLVSEGTAAVARLVGSSAAPLAVKATAVGVGVAVVGGGGVVVEQKLEPRPADAARPAATTPAATTRTSPLALRVRNEGDTTPRVAVVHASPVVPRTIVRDEGERGDDHLRAGGRDHGDDGRGPSVAATGDGDLRSDASGRGGGGPAEVTIVAPEPAVPVVTPSGHDASGSGDVSHDGGHDGSVSIPTTSVVSSSGEHAGGDDASGGLQTTTTTMTTSDGDSTSTGQTVAATDGSGGDGHDGGTVTTTTTSTTDGDGGSGGGSGPH